MVEAAGLPPPFVDCFLLLLVRVVENVVSLDADEEDVVDRRNNDGGRNPICGNASDPVIKAALVFAEAELEDAARLRASRSTT